MTTDNDSQDARHPTVGERLRKAREVAGLSVTDVAERQHLRPAVISAIESADYRKIDSELFLKGYVRAYASHVGIDPESVVRQLDQELEPLREEQKAQFEANPLVDIERRKRRKQRIARIVITLLVLVVLFYAGSLYLASQESPVPEPASESRDNEPPAPDEQDEQSVPDDDQQSPVEPSSAPDQPEGASDMPEAPGDAADNDTAGMEDEVEAGASQAPVSDIGSGSPNSVDASPGVVGLESNRGSGATAETDAGPESGSDTRTGEDGQGSEVVSTPLSEPATPAGGNGEGQLVVEFSDACWVEVQDSNGRTLAAELRSAGDTLEVSGDAPLRVVLGAVDAVSSLSYSGEAVDLTDRRAPNNRLVLSLPE